MSTDGSSDDSSDSRFLEIDTPLGDGVLTLVSFTGTEGLSQLFRYELEMFSSESSIAPEDLVGKAVTVTLGGDSDSPRYFNGYVSRLEAGDVLQDEDDVDLRVYRAEMVPWLWLLGTNENALVFQEMSRTDIVQKVFDAAGFSDYQLKLQGSPATLDYCLQYFESDLAFVSRLLEQEGLFYYFLHEDGKHTLVVSDNASAYYDCDESSVDYSEDDSDRTPGTISDWAHGFSFRPGTVTLDDYDFTAPTNDLTATTDTVIPLSGSTDYERYEYPGLYTQTSVGSGLAKARMEEQEATYEVVTGKGTCASFGAGGAFTLATHVVSDEQQKYALVRVSHSARAPLRLSGGGGGGEGYLGEFECVPAPTAYRPPRVTPVPRVHGLQSAVVVGPSDQVVYTDEYGRVRVQFHWDRVGELDENSSCWIRVAQPWAGKQVGTMFLPRVGDEVLVDFLQGNPDRPIVVGSAWNADQTLPYDLPTDNVKTAIRTQSFNGGDDNYNELVFDDTQGSEMFSLHAERDFERVVENDDTLTVGYDAQDPGDQTIKVYNNRTVEIDQGDDSLTLNTGSRNVTVEQEDSLTVNSGGRTVSIEKDDSLTVNSGDRTVKISSGSRSVTVQSDDSLTVNSGDLSISVSAGQASVEAMQGISLKVGSNEITIDQQGVTIKGIQVAVSGDMQLDLKAPLASLQADAELTLKGGMVMIN